MADVKDLPNTVLDKIRSLAQLTVDELSPLCSFPFAFDERSIRWLDGYIERRRADHEMMARGFNGLVNVFGAYLGECLVRAFDGQWKDIDGSLGVTFAGGSAAFPFAKVQKRFENGPEDSISSFFEVIPALLGASAESTELR